MRFLIVYSEWQVQFAQVCIVYTIYIANILLLCFHAIIEGATPKSTCMHTIPPS